MKLKKSNILLFSIIALLTSLTLVSCNKKNVEIIEQDKTPTQQVSTVTDTKSSSESTKDPIITNEVVSEDSNDDEIIVKESAVMPLEKDSQLNLSDYGFELKDDLLYYNNNLISDNKIINYNIDLENAVFNFVDGTSLDLSANGIIDTTFPIGIKLYIDNTTPSYIISYMGVSVELPTIQNFSAIDGWYTITLSDNSYIKFNDEDLIISLDKLSFTLSNEVLITAYDNIVISNSNIENLDINIPKINISYVDGTELEYTFEKSTKFTLENGYSINAENNLTTFLTNEDVNTLDGELQSIIYDDEMKAITFSTQSDSYTLYLSENMMDKTIDTNMIADETIVNDTQAVVDNDTTINTSETEVSETASNNETNNTKSINVSQNKSVDNFDTPQIFNNIVEKPFRIGMMSNYTFFNGALKENGTSEFTNFGLRADFVIEKEFSANWLMGLELGLGADKFSVGFVKQFAPMFTITNELNLFNDKKLSPYVKGGIGSLIFINENGTSPFFRAKLGLGLNYDINDTYIINVATNYNFLYKSKVVSHAFDIQAGLTYRY